MSLNLIKRYFFNLFGIIFSRLSGLGRDLILSAFFGASAYSDMFFIMLRLPQIFRSLLTEGVFNQAFLPHLRAAARKGAFVASVFMKMLILCFLISLVLSIFAPFAAKLLAPGLAADLQEQAASLIRFSIWFLFFIFIACFLGSLCNYEQKFFLPSCINAIFNIVCMICLPLALYFGKFQALKICAFAISFGAIIQAIILLIALRHSKLFKAAWQSLKNAQFASSKGFFKSFGASLLAASSNSLGSIFEFAIASSYASAAITYIQLSTRLYQLPLALIAIAFSQVFLPAILGKKSARESSGAYFWLLFVALCAAAFVGYFFAEYIFRLLFMRGAFTSEEAHAASLILESYIFLIIPLGLSKVFLSQLAADFKQGKAALISALCVACNCVLILVFLPHFGMLSFGYAASISALLLLVGYIFAAGRLISLSILFHKFAVFALAAVILEFLLIRYLKGLFDVYF